MAKAASSHSLSADAAAGKKIALVVSKYHEELTQELHKGAVEALKKHGVKADDLYTAWVPGAFEIPLAARALSHQDFDAIVCLGVIIKGETTHDQVIAAETARGISAVAQSAGIPVSFGVLTTQTLEQAKARCGGDHGHKGVEAAEAAVMMIGVLDAIDNHKGVKETRSVGFGGR